MNSVAIMGRLGQDPELKTTNSGNSVCSFSVAIPKYSKTAGQGADWIRCTAWNGTAEFISKYFRKGQMIAIEGRLNVNQWADETGKHSMTEVVANNASFCGSRQEPEEPAPAKAKPDIVDDDPDDLPF